MVRSPPSSPLTQIDFALLLPSSLLPLPCPSTFRFDLRPTFSLFYPFFHIFWRHSFRPSRVLFQRHLMFPCRPLLRFSVIALPQIVLSFLFVDSIITNVNAYECQDGPDRA
jgi:hypothetical protein